MNSRDIKIQTEKFLIFDYQYIKKNFYVILSNLIIKERLFLLSTIYALNLYNVNICQIIIRI